MGMTAVLLAVVTGAAGLVVGFAIGRFGTFVQVLRIEAEVRALANDVAVTAEIENDDMARWAADQIDTFVNRTFR
jgi:hypothetical protein